jgi:hypothetical protein
LSSQVPAGLIVRNPSAPPATAVIAGALHDTVKVPEGTLRRLSSYGSSDGSIGRATFTWSLDGTQVATGLRALPNALTFDTAFADQGSHTLTLHMSDVVGGNSTATATLQVVNVAPTIAWTSTPSLSGKTLTLCPSFSDRGAQDGPWSYAILWGDGYTTAGSAAVQGPLGCFQHTFGGVSGRAYTARARVTDKDGGARALGYELVLP